MSDINLVIVESPGKVATITKYLNNNPELKKLGKFVVMASVGHIRELPPKSLGIDIENNFKLTYQFSELKKKVIADLIKNAKNAKTVYLAGDADSEGTFISESVRVALNLGQNYKRITFTEISPKALQYSILHAGKIDQDQLEAQETRRSLDRLVGYKLSPILWKKFTTGGASHLSAGRVQSAVLHMVIQKEIEIQKYKPNKYWYFYANFDLKIVKESQKLEEIKLYQGSTVYKDSNEDSTKLLLKKIKYDFNISDINSKESRQKPDLPFITSTLQQSAGFPIKRTMQLAQELYEAGLITYMRTDSTNISEDFKIIAQDYVTKIYGANYLGDTSDMKKAKVVKGAQEAHECIRPVNINLVNIKSEGAKITKDHEKLYELIWRRTVAYFMKACIYDELELKIVDTSFPRDMYFLAGFKKVKFNGFQIVYGIKSENYDFSKYITNIKNKNYTIKCESITAKNTWSSPPGRYNEIGLIKMMESEGIGRPSTYSATIQKVTDRQYVNKTDVQGEEKTITNYMLVNGTVKAIQDKIFVGQEKSKFVPTEIGIQVDRFLQENFDYIVNIGFTANMEADLDRIAEGKKSRVEVLNAFWKPFVKDLDKFGKIAKEDKIAIKTESNDFVVNKIKYTVRLTRFGPVIQYEEKQGEEKQGEAKQGEAKLKKNIKYIDLKNYLKYTGKEYTDIQESDIKFLVKLPMKVGEVKGKEVIIVSGPYGLYLKYDGQNLKITQKTIREFIDTSKVSQSDIEASIEYNQNKTPKKTITKN